MLQINAQKITDEQKMKDIYNNKNLYLKLKSKIEKENEQKFRHTNIRNEEEKNPKPNIKDKRFKLLQKSKKNKR